MRVELVLGVLLLPLAATLAVALLRGFVVFLWVLCTGDSSGRDADAEAGRIRAWGRHRPDRHLVTPAIGRKGWTKR
jgi:hypothetical protein